MSHREHTPWSVRENQEFEADYQYADKLVGGVVAAYEVVDARGNAVTEEFSHRDDAALIAAAPRMYALIQKLAEQYADTDAPTGVEARAIIAAVEGRDA